MRADPRPRPRACDGDGPRFAAAHRRARRGLWIAIAAAASCPLGYAPAAAGAEVVVSLLWEAPVDLDLYVTDPRGESFYYGNRGTVLERDARCDDGTTGVRSERARIAGAAAGRYRIGVDYPEACDDRFAQRAVPYRVVVDGPGGRRETTGTARPLERSPRVVEVELP